MSRRNRVGGYARLALSWLLLGACSVSDDAASPPADVGVTLAALSSPPSSGCSVMTSAGHEYWFCRQAQSWSNAQAKCRAVGLELARVDSAVENDFINANVSGDSWIGASDQAAEGTWRWSNNGDQFWSGGALGGAVSGRYARWRLLQPDNLLNQDCAALEPLLTASWSDRSCSDVLAYVCEAPLTAGDPGIDCQATGAPADAAWPSFKRCASGQGRSPTRASVLPSPVATFSTGDAIDSSPAIAADGTVYVGSADTYVYAVAPDGTQRWRFKTNGQVHSSPAIGSDGTIYIGSDDNYLYALRPDGTQRWRFQTGNDVRSSPRIGADGTIYFGSNDGRVYALQSTGTKKWDFLTILPVRSSAAISPDGTIYIGADDSRLYALNADGTKRWHYQTLGAVTAAAVLGADGTVYAASNDGQLYALNAGTGSLRWQFNASNAIASSPALRADGAIVFGDNRGRVRSLDANGVLNWQFDTGAAVASAPAIDADGNIFIGSDSRRLYALDGASGAQRWSVLTGGAIDSSPAIAATGTVYVGSLDAKLYGIGGGPTPRVQCISQVGGERYAALFGYDNRASIPIVIARGPDNAFTTPPSDPSVQPIETFQPGSVDVGFWAPFPVGGALTWSLRGRTATANSASPRCTDAAYPRPPADPGMAGVMGAPEAPSRMAMNLPKLASYATDTEHQLPNMQPSAFGMSSGTGTTTNEDGIGVTVQELTGVTAPFLVRLTQVTVQPDGLLASPDVDGKVTINGQDAGTAHLYDCGGFGNGCILGPYDLDELFVIDVPADQTTVPVRIEVIDRDNLSADDLEVDVNLLVDNQTGSWSGSTSSPTHCQTNSDGWSICWEIVRAGLPTSLAPTRLCASWNADYVDEGRGEDFVGTPTTPGGPKEYPASFAEFFLDAVGPTGNLHVGAFYDDMGSLMPGSPPPAFLDADGCIPAGVIPPEQLIARSGAAVGDIAAGGIDIQLTWRSNLVRPDGVRYIVVDATTERGHVLRARASLGDIPVTGYTNAGAWSLPPAELRAHTPVLDPVGETSAVLSRILTQEDSGIVPSEYVARVNDGCLFGGQLNSCVSGSTLLIGPALLPPNAQACTVDADCPSVQLCLPAQGTGALMCHWPPQSRWKFITAHEAGHQIQGRAMGSLGGSYTFTCPEGATCPGRREGSSGATGPLVDPPFADSFCGCQHVKAANAQHCLQSIEEAPRSHLEGYAQFYASKTWNRRDQNDCTFTYYKEFLIDSDTCPPGNECEMFVTAEHGPRPSVLPPVAVSCKTPFVKPGGVATGWRNNFCPINEAAQFVTELDFLGFLWNINTAPATQRSSMEDIFFIYRHACHPEQPLPGLCAGADIAWEPVRNTAGALVRPGFREGAELRKGLDTDAFDFILEQGRIFSVSPELP